MHSHQMAWENCALRVSSNFGPLPSANLKTQHIFTVRRPRVIKPTLLVTGPLKVTRLGTNTLSVLHILTWASTQGNTFPKLLVTPELLKLQLLAKYFSTRHQKLTEAMRSSIAARDKPS